jgi:hypothetical protein
MQLKHSPDKPEPKRNWLVEEPFGQKEKDGAR